MVTKSTIDTTAGAEKRDPGGEPFAALVTPSPKKKTITKTLTKPQAVTRAAAPKVTPKKKAADIDPFASIAEPEASPTKPRAKKAKPKQPTAAKTPRADKPPTKAAPVKKSAKTAGEKKRPRKAPQKVVLTSALKPSPEFLTLAEPVLPELKRENRARLQMQTPTRLYFYWSAKDNPWALLREAFGSDPGAYSLVLKLTDLSRDIEELKPAEPEGNFWFDVEAGRQYQAEIGFYAPNRPYFRIIFSNTVETPRRNPSPRAATDADWRVSANKFAEVLDVAGFSQDAFDVALAGDDIVGADEATHNAFSRFVGQNDYRRHGVPVEDIRYAMLAIAAGLELEDLRHRISPALFAVLQANAGNLAPSEAMGALTENFDIDESEFSNEEPGPAVYGASLVHFPRNLKTRGLSPKQATRYNPLSSHSLR